MKKIVNILGVSSQYQTAQGQVDALANISMEVAEGEFVSIVGPSGCGKSTLLSILAGLIAPAAGQVLIHGHPVTGPTAQVGLMPQQDQLFAWRTVRENVLLGLQVQRRLCADTAAYADSLLAAYGLKDFAHLYPASLSGGMRQRAALIRTLATRPSLLLLDEPFSSLDYQTRLTVSADIHRILKQQQKTALLVTHDLAEAICLSDRVVVFSHRPAVVQAEYPICFDGEAVSPLSRRDHPLFRTYFHQLWRELTHYDTQYTP